MKLLLFLIGAAFIIYTATSAVVNVIDLTIDGLPHRRFFNASLGLEYNEDVTSHCNASLRDEEGTGKTFEMIYTPNRRLQSTTIEDALNDKVQLAIVLAVGGHGDSHYDYGPDGSLNGLLAVWDSWVQYFFSYTSNTASFVMLLDERDYLKHKNISGWTTKQYMDNVVINNMGGTPVDCIHFRNRSATGNHHRDRERKDKSSSSSSFHGRSMAARHKPSGGFPAGHKPGCSNDIPHLDSGYRVYYIDVATPSNLDQKPLIIFVAVHKFPVPEWAKNEDEEALFKNWRPPRLVARYKRYPTNYAYVKMTNWYSYHMLNLRLLDFFDYGGKLDNDVSFVSPFPAPNLPYRMASNRSYMLMTQRQWYPDDARIAQGSRSCLDSYTNEQKKLCRVPDESIVKGRGMRNDTFWDPELKVTFRAHFLIFWFGLYAAPETRRMAKFWNDWHPGGMWDYRWGDQQWWPRPISTLGSGNLQKEIDCYDTIDTDNEKYLVHKLWPRWHSIPHVRYFDNGMKGGVTVTGVTNTTKDTSDAARSSREFKFKKAEGCFKNWQWKCAGRIE